VAGLDPDRAAVADPQPNSVDVEDRVNLIQRPGAPFFDYVVDGVGDVGDRLVSDGGRRRDVFL
jgi:hypothetical protein